MSRPAGPVNGSYPDRERSLRRRPGWHAYRTIRSVHPVSVHPRRGEKRLRDNDSGSTVVIGAGPAGLTAACRLASAEVPVTVFEADEVVGGISRTVERDGWRFDIGGHRFFTKVGQVEAFWHEILP